MGSSSPSPVRLGRALPWLLGVFMVLVACLEVHSAIEWYGHPFANVLTDPDGVVSTFGSPAWAGSRRGLRFPDALVAVDGAPIAPQSGEAPGDAWNRAVDDAWARGERTIEVTVKRDTSTRTVELPLERLSVGAWWISAGVPIIAGVLYALAGLTALFASPRGALARTFAKAAIASSILLLGIFDLHTTRRLVWLWTFGFALSPPAFVGLALRLPDDAPILKRRGWLLGLFDLAGVALALATIIERQVGIAPTALASINSAAIAASQLFFVTTFLVRFLRARGGRRQVMQALVMAVGPLHALVGLGFFLAFLTSRVSAATIWAILPFASLTPLASVVAFIRHDLWGSRTLLSRVLTLAMTGAFACFLAACIAAGFSASLGIPFGTAALAGAVGSLCSAAIVSILVRGVDRGFFPAHTEYKPTVEHLSEHLTAITDPAEVARAIERTVRRWLACESVVFAPHDGNDTPAPPLPPVSGGNEKLDLPVQFRGATLGTLHVGRKLGGALFTSEDVALLRTIANQAAVAIAHALSYRELEERRRQQAEAWRGERVALIETVAAEIAHEIRYPINYFRSVFERGTSELDTETIEIGCEEVGRLERLVAGLRRVTQNRLERRVITVTAVAARAEVLLRDALGMRRIDTLIPDGAAMRADFDQITQVIVNLLSNAVDAAGPTGQIGLMWRELESDGACLVVWDTGPGFEGDASRLFAPWFTTKPRGTGLGLAIAQRIVRTHGWTIDAKRSEGRTHFLVTVPAGDVVRDGSPSSGASAPLDSESGPVRLH